MTQPYGGRLPCLFRPNSTEAGEIVHFAGKPESRSRHPIRMTSTVRCGRSLKLLFRIAISLLCFAAAIRSAHASVALLMEEPYGRFGAMNPTGHAAIYLNHICADSPIVLRPCHDGEYGVVISRYHKIDGYDWLAVPLTAYLYAVDTPADIPETVDKDQVWALRNAYRQQHLLDLAPDDKEGDAPKGEWTELVGSSYDRVIHG